MADKETLAADPKKNERGLQYLRVTNVSTGEEFLLNPAIIETIGESYDETKEEGKRRFLRLYSVDGFWNVEGTIESYIAACRQLSIKPNTVCVRLLPKWDFVDHGGENVRDELNETIPDEEAVNVTKSGRKS